MLLQRAKPLSVLLVEHDLVLQGAIGDAIVAEPAFELAASCGSRHEALQAIESMRLDIVLVSLKLADGSGLEVVQAVKQFQPLAEVLAMGSVDDKEDFFSSLQAGATACLLKENFSHLNRARKNSVVGSMVFGQVLGKVLDGNAAVDACDEASIAELSPIQRDILRCLAGGLSNKEIARRLLMSSYNVDYHLKSLRKRFSVHNRVQLIGAAMAIFRTDEDAGTIRSVVLALPSQRLRVEKKR